MSIESDSITLRKYNFLDIQCWQKWEQDTKVQAFLPEPRIEMNNEEQQKYLQDCLEEKDAMYWSIIDKETNKCIGSIALTDINDYHGLAELGIIIGETEYWGKGIAKNAIQMVIEKALKTRKLRRILAEFEVQNEGMKKALIAVGFKQECLSCGSRLKNGQPIDTYRYVYMV